jgi:hypothetical protein
MRWGPYHGTFSGTFTQPKFATLTFHGTVVFGTRAPGSNDTWDLTNASFTWKASGHFGPCKISGSGTTDLSPDNARGSITVNDHDAPSVTTEDGVRVESGKYFALLGPGGTRAGGMPSMPGKLSCAPTGGFNNVPTRTYKKNLAGQWDLYLWTGVQWPPQRHFNKLSGTNTFGTTYVLKNEWDLAEGG